MDLSCFPFDSDVVAFEIGSKYMGSKKVRITGPLECKISAGCGGGSRCPLINSLQAMLLRPLTHVSTYA